MGMDPAENDLLEIAKQWFEIKNHKLDPEVDAILDEIDARKAAEAEIEEARPTGAVYVCPGRSTSGCGQTFTVKPLICPRCGRSYVKLEEGSSSLMEVLESKFEGSDET